MTRITTTYRGLSVREPAPYGEAGAAWQANFVALADRIGTHVEADADPTVDDDEVGTAGNRAVMALSTWRNTSDDSVWQCIDATEGTAVWVRLTGVDWTAATENLHTEGSVQADAGIGAGGEPVDGYSLAVRQSSDSAAIRIWGTDIANHASMYVDASGAFRPTSTGSLFWTSGGYFAFSSGAGGHLYNYIGGYWYLRDRDASNAIRVQIDSAATPYPGRLVIPEDADNSIVLGAGNDAKLGYDGLQLVVEASGGVYMPQDLVIAPGSSVTPANNGDVAFELTNDTTLTIRAKGSDGVERSAVLDLF